MLTQYRCDVLRFLILATSALTRKPPLWGCLKHFDTEIEFDRQFNEVLNRGQYTHESWTQKAHPRNIL